MSVISPEIHTIILIITGIAGFLFALLLIVLEENLRYAVLLIFRGNGRRPSNKHIIIWFLFYLSTIIMIGGAVITGVTTSSDLPAARTMHYFFIVDSSSRMEQVFSGSDSKWYTINQVLKFRLLLGIPKRSNFGLIVLGGNQPESTHSCNQEENRIIIPMRFDNLDKIIKKIETVGPGGIASLNDALVRAKETLFDTPQNQHKALLLFLGGGDDCATDKWFFLERFLESNANLLSESRMDIVVFPGEDEIIKAVDDIQKTIDENKLTTKVTVYTPGNITELNAAIDVIRAQALRDALEFEPAAATVAEATVSALALLPTSETQPTASSTPIFITPSIGSPTPTLTFTPTRTFTSTPTFTPTPTLTFTPTRTFTSTPTFTPTLTVTPIFTMSPPPNCVEWNWEFSTDGNSEGWRASPGITLDVQNGSLIGEVLQGGYWMGPDNLTIEAAIHKSLEMRYRVDSVASFDAAYFYWLKEGDPLFGDNKRIKFDIQTDNTWQIESINLAQSVNWNDIITGIRLYPVGNSNALVEYDYIRLCQ